MPYDNNLQQLQQKVALKKQLEAKLNDLREQHKVFDKQVVELRVAHRSERENVEMLEGKSLTNYFYQVIGKLEDKLTEERRQAATARVKLDAAEHELAAVDCEIQEIQSQLSELYGCENAYASALQKKRAEIKESGTSAGAEILELKRRSHFWKVRNGRSGKHSLPAGMPCALQMRCSLS